MEEKCGRILVADDNEELCRMIETILTAEGYRHVTYVLSCEEAEKLLRQESFDLLVLDVNFPGEDGFSFFARLRQTRDIPVLFLSARDQSGDKLRGLGLGADDYMTKPFLPKELALRIGAILRRLPERAAAQDFPGGRPGGGLRRRAGAVSGEGGASGAESDQQRVPAVKAVSGEPGEDSDSGCDFRDGVGRKLLWF